MLKGTAGQLILQSVLPEDMRQPDRVLDKKGMSKLLTELAQKHPDQYSQVLHQLMRVSHQAAYWTNAQSFGLKHLRGDPSVRKLRQELQQQTEAIWNNSRLSDREKEARIVTLSSEYQSKIEAATFAAAQAAQNPLAEQVVSGSRGNKTQLNTLLGAPVLYTDHNGDPIPFPVLRSFSEGLRPYEYYASTFGARSGLIDTKLSVADTGFLSKQFVQAAHRLLVSAIDADKEDDTVRGFPVSVDDPDNEGAYLAQPVGPYKRNTLLTPAILSDLQKQGVKRLLVRSPTVGGPADGGVYSRDVGMREKGRPAPLGDFVGVAAAQAASEALTQGALSSKHSAGVAGANKSMTGFHLINQLIQVPKTFTGGASHARLDGKVEKIVPAAQGGHYVRVGGVEHYVGQGFDITVKPGDEVEAGDVLSDGIPNPAEVVRYKGIGEGRRYFTQTMLDAYRRSGITAHRRNLELIARGLINHVRLKDEFDEFVPEDVMQYSHLEHRWQPREGHQVVDPRQARGWYLEKPVLHYSVGTPIRPSVIKNLQEFNIKQIAAHREPPPFEPEMVRGLENLTHDPDWQTRFLGSYVKKNLLKGVHRGDVSDERGTSYVPSLTRAVDFNKWPPVKGYSTEEHGPVKRPIHLSPEVDS